MARQRQRRALGLLAGLLTMVGTSACQEPNPNFDGPAASTTTGDSSTGASTGTPSDTSADTVMPGTADGTSASTTDTPPDTSGTSSSSGGTTEMGGSTTEGCMGMVCGGSCIDPQTDNNHCGMCDNKCVGQQECIDGVCAMP